VETKGAAAVSPRKRQAPLPPDKNAAYRKMEGELLSIFSDDEGEGRVIGGESEPSVKGDARDTVELEGSPSEEEERVEEEKAGKETGAVGEDLPDFVSRVMREFDTRVSSAPPASAESKTEEGSKKRAGRIRKPAKRPPPPRKEIEALKDLFSEEE